MALLQDLSAGLSHLLFPRSCEGCCQPLMKQEEVLCLVCHQALPRTGYHHIPDNEAALRFAGRIPYRHVTALSVFTPGGLLQHLLHQLKYQHKQEIGTFLGRQLGYDLQHSNWAGDIDLIVPVPLHPRKEATRGYNQSALIGGGLAEILGKTMAPRALQRTRFTESQTQKSRAARVLNVHAAFSLNDEAALRNKHLLLLDDVLTTGATLEAAATALLSVTGLRLSIATIGIAMG